MLDWVQGLFDTAFRDPSSLLVGVFVGLVIGFFIGLSSSRLSM